jgi:hypothetical protein
MSHRTAWLTALTALLAASSAAPASAFEASAALSPSTIAYYGPNDQRTTRTVQSRLTVTAGPQDERVIVEETHMRVGEGDPVVEGVATLTAISASTLVGDDFGSPGRDGCRPGGYALTTSRYELALPANSTSTIVFTRPLSRTSAPHGVAEFTTGFVLAPTPAAGERERLVGEIVVTTPPPVLAGLVGARLVLRAGRSGAGVAKTIGAREGLAVKAGAALTLSGYLDRARGGERVTIWAYAPRTTTPRRLAVVRVGRNGRFMYRPWRPSAAGTWELYASWPGRAGTVERVRSGCGGPQVHVGTTAQGEGRFGGP